MEKVKRITTHRHRENGGKQESPVNKYKKTYSSRNKENDGKRRTSSSKFWKPNTSRQKGNWAGHSWISWFVVAVLLVLFILVLAVGVFKVDTFLSIGIDYIINFTVKLAPAFK